MPSYFTPYLNFYQKSKTTCIHIFPLDTSNKIILEKKIYFFVTFPVLEHTDQWEVVDFQTPPPAISDWLRRSLREPPSMFLSGGAR